MASESARLALSSDPWTQLQSWLSDAEKQNLPLPEALSLATATPDGKPSLRTVLFKGVHDGGLCFFTNYGSRKARELDSNPQAAVSFHWHPLERQVIIEGRVERTSRGESEAYFLTRPRESQLGAHASRQGTIVPNAEVLQKKYEELERIYSGQEVPLPDFWGGYRLIPTSFEFWSGGTGRLHDRFLYLPAPSNRSEWTIQRLSP